MTLVRSRLVTPAGVPRSGVRVTAELVASAGWLMDHSGEISGPAPVKTDGDGWWELDLIPTGRIEVTGTHYRILELGTPPHLHWHAVQVPEPNPAVPFVLMRDILVDPATLAPVGPGLPPGVIAHAGTHAAGGADPVSPGSIGAALTSHAHLNPSGLLSAPMLIGGVWTVTVESNWGLTAGGAAYYDALGAVPSDAAIASLDATGVLVLTRPGG